MGSRSYRVPQAKVGKSKKRSMGDRRDHQVPSNSCSKQTSATRLHFLPLCPYRPLVAPASSSSTRDSQQSGWLAWCHLLLIHPHHHFRCLLESRRSHPLSCIHHLQLFTSNILCLLSSNIQLTTTHSASLPCSSPPNPPHQWLPLYNRRRPSIFYLLGTMAHQT